MKRKQWGRIPSSLIFKQIVILLFYVGIAALSMNLLILHLHEYVGSGQGESTDYYHSYWNYWWIRHALTTPGLSVYETDFVLFPFKNSLALHTLAPFWFPLWAVLEPLTNVFVATNTILWIGLAFTGFVTYLFLRDQGVGRRAALIGGVVVSMQPAYTWATAMTLPVYVAGFWFPLALLCWKRVAHTRQVIWAVVMGLIFWCMLMTDHASLVILAVIIVPYGIWTLVPAARESRRAFLKITALGLLAIFIFLALGYGIAPIRQLMAFDRDSVSPASLDSTTRFSLPLKGLYRTWGYNDAGIGITITLIMLVSLITALRQPRRDRERWFWFILGILCLILALGPYLGSTSIPLPYQLAYNLTGGLFRTPSRFAPPGIILLLVFVWRTWQPIKIARSAKILLSALLLLALLTDLRVLRPFPAKPPVTAYQFYADIGQEEGDYVVVNVPVSIGSGWIIYGNFTEAQFYGITHQKRTMNGLIARIPAYEYETFVFEPTIGWLGGFQPLKPDIITPRLRELSESYPIGYIAVHQDYLNLATQQAEEIIGFFNSLDYLCPVTVEGVAVLYRTLAHPDFDQCPPRRFGEVNAEIDFGVPGDEFFIGLGFHRQEIIGGPNGRWLGAFDMDHAYVYIDLLPGRDYTLTLEATAFIQPREVTIWAGEQALGTFTVTEAGYGQYSVTIPAGVIPEDEKVALRLAYGDPVSAAELGLSGDTRPLSIALNWMRFEEMPTP